MLVHAERGEEDGDEFVGYGAGNLLDCRVRIVQRKRVHISSIVGRKGYKSMRPKGRRGD